MGGCRSAAHRHEPPLLGTYLIAETLLQILATLPVITATGERSFSALKLIKTHLSTSMHGAAAPGFNSLIPAPSVPSLISTEPVELLCRASNISSTDPFCFVKQKQKTVEAFLQFLFTNMRSSSQRAQNEYSRR